MRQHYDLGHYCVQAGRMGHLQTLAAIPVIAGDSLEVKCNNIMRLSPLRRALTIDAQVDYFAFYVPHRHIYGSDWTDMIKEGMTGSNIMPKLTVSGGVYYLGQTMDANAGAFAKYLFAGYNRIWNRYFRFLKNTVAVPDDYVGAGVPAGGTLGVDTPINGTANVKAYGFNCSRLKMPWTVGIQPDIIDADHEAAVTSGGTVLDIIDLKRTEKYYKTKIELEWFAQRYNDVLKTQFGSGVNTDADERPTLIWHKAQSMSGYDVDGTGDASLGTFSGKSVGHHQFGFPRRHFPEHGCVWIMALVRFPTIGTREISPLSRGTQTYKELAGNFDVVASEPPAETDLDKWMSSPAGSTSLGTTPYGYEYRHQHNNISYLYEALQGYPFLYVDKFATLMASTYIQELDYDPVFLSQQLGHWQTFSTIQVDALRDYPTAKQSIFAGAY